MAQTTEEGLEKEGSGKGKSEERGPREEGDGEC